MSFFTALSLSFNNLRTKKARTLLTSFAGSIGIIGICAVLAVSSGVRGYIASMQDDMLSGNPITIQETAYDLDAIMGDMSVSEKQTALSTFRKSLYFFAIRMYNNPKDVIE